MRVRRVHFGLRDSYNETAESGQRNEEYLSMYGRGSVAVRVGSLLLAACVREGSTSRPAPGPHTG
jgi:hypothetical protein